MSNVQPPKSPWSGPWEHKAGPHLGCPHDHPEDQPRREQCRLWGRAEHVSSVSCPRHPDSSGIAPPTQTVPALTLSCLFSDILHFYFLQAFCNFSLTHFFFYDSALKPLSENPNICVIPPLTQECQCLLCFLIPVGVFLALGMTSNCPSYPGHLEC